MISTLSASQIRDLSAVCYGDKVRPSTAVPCFLCRTFPSETPHSAPFEVVQPAPRRSLLDL